MPAMIRLALLVMTAALALAVEPPAVPDPYGLGERLALIDVLKETYGQVSQPGASLEDLRARYQAAWAATQVRHDDARERDACQRLRAHLRLTYGVDSPADANEAGLTTLLHIAQSEAASARGAALADVFIRAAKDTSPDRPAPTAVPTASATTPEFTPPTTLTVIPAAASEAATIDLCSALDNVPAKVTRWTQGDRALLCVQFGEPGGVDFDGCCRMVEYLISHSDVGVKRAAFLIGHGGGTDVGGTDLQGHLAKFRTVYETAAGALPAKPLDCLILASCSKGGTVQMRTMRDGLGYYPTWRVCTGHRTYANVPTVIAASLGALSHRADEGFRGSYRWNDNGVEAASTAEVGEGSKSGNLEVFRVSVKDGRLEITPQR